MAATTPVTLTVKVVPELDEEAVAALRERLEAALREPQRPRSLPTGTPAALVILVPEEMAEEGYQRVAKLSGREWREVLPGLQAKLWCSHGDDEHMPVSDPGCEPDTVSFRLTPFGLGG